MNKKLIWTTSAFRDLDIIYEFESKRSVARADHIIEALLEKPEVLREFPEIGQEEASLKRLQKGHRYLVVEEDYKIIYRYEPPYIYVTTVFDVRQDPVELIQKAKSETL